MSTPMTQMRGPETVTIKITPANPPKVSIDPAEISKSNGDQVQWECPDSDSGFQVHFPANSPFANKSFDERNPRSGQVRGDAGPGKYHYTVTVKNQTLDPGLIVKR